MSMGPLFQGCQCWICALMPMENFKPFGTPWPPLDPKGLLLPKTVSPWLRHIHIHACMHAYMLVKKLLSSLLRNHNAVKDVRNHQAFVLDLIELNQFSTSVFSASFLLFILMKQCLFYLLNFIFMKDGNYSKVDRRSFQFVIWVSCISELFFMIS